jgi:tetraacyldisaccharide 4'-kinase
MLPVGYLREDFNEAVSRADAVIFVNRLGTKDVTHLTPYLQIPAHVPVLQFSLLPSHVVDVASGTKLALSTLAEKRAGALTAIGNPDHFFMTLDGLGMNLLSRQAHRDHHSFSLNTWKKALAAGRGCVITTEKDAVKLRRYADKNRQLLALVLKSAFNNESQERLLMQLISSKLELLNDERYELSER